VPADGLLVDLLVECLALKQEPVAGTDHARHALELTIAAKTAAREGTTAPLETTFAS
jgi:hypothetical protein